MDAIKKEISEAAKKQSQLTEDDVYEEVFIDEVNQELLKNVMTAEGDTVVLLVRQERLKKFTDVWRQANLEYYNTQSQSDFKLKKQSKLLVQERL